MEDPQVTMGFNTKSWSHDLYDLGTRVPILGNPKWQNSTWIWCIGCASLGKTANLFYKKNEYSQCGKIMQKKYIYIFELLIWFVELPSKLFFHVVFFQIFVPYFPMQK